MARTARSASRFLFWHLDQIGPPAPGKLGGAWLFDAAVAALAVFLCFRLPWETWDKIILLMGAGGMVATCQVFPQMRRFWATLLLLSAAALALPPQGIWRAGYFSKESLFLWAEVFMGCALIFSWAELLFRAPLGWGARLFSWWAAGAGTLSLFFRWQESRLLGMGHLPLANLFEVMLLFCIVTILLALYWQEKRGAGRILPWALSAVALGAGFLLWYDRARGGGRIEPLVPALQSYWMKLHVPANFLGYGAFSIASALGAARLALRLPFFASRLANGSDPRLLAKAMDEQIYRAVALGFVFFTLATILGSVWAAEAWGGYWSWDPKETWALIVWLNYAAWLHGKKSARVSPQALALWAVAGFFVTLFCFLGVNLWLSGMHSYGKL